MRERENRVENTIENRKSSVSVLPQEIFSVLPHAQHIQNILRRPTASGLIVYALVFLNSVSGQTNHACCQHLIYLGEAWWDIISSAAYTVWYCKTDWKREKKRRRECMLMCTCCKLTCALYSSGPFVRLHFECIGTWLWGRVQYTDFPHSSTHTHKNAWNIRIHASVFSKSIAANTYSVWTHTMMHIHGITAQTPRTRGFIQQPEVRSLSISLSLSFASHRAYITYTNINRNSREHGTRLLYT